MLAFSSFKTWDNLLCFLSIFAVESGGEEVVLLVTSVSVLTDSLSWAQSDSQPKCAIDHCNLLILWRLIRFLAFFLSFFVLHRHFCAYRGRFSPSISGRWAAGTLEPFCVRLTLSSRLNKFQLNPFFPPVCPSASHLLTLSCDTWDNICLQHVKKNLSFKSRRREREGEIFSVPVLKPLAVVKYFP